jgi:hypothetical protein
MSGAGLSSKKTRRAFIFYEAGSDAGKSEMQYRPAPGGDLNKRWPLSVHTRNIPRGANPIKPQHQSRTATAPSRHDEPNRETNGDPQSDGSHDECG